MSKSSAESRDICKSPFFSVIIPAYNRSSTIKPTLMSVVAQSHCDFECVIVDDGSEDGDSLQGVVASLGDDRFRYIRRDNGGGGAARNTGIEAARGRYIAFLDSGDLFLPDKLERVRDFIDRTGAVAVYSKAYVDRGRGDRVWIRPDRELAETEDVGEYLFVSNQFIPTPTIVMSVEAARLVRFDPELRKGQDLDFCLRVQSKGFRFRMIDAPLIVWVDAKEVGRASRHAGARAPTLWLRRSSNLLTRKARLGYRATVLAYYQPKWKFAIVGWDFLIAYLVAGVSGRVIVRQILRFCLPRKGYRWLVDRFVGVKGHARIGLP